MAGKRVKMRNAKFGRIKPVRTLVYLPFPLPTLWQAYHQINIVWNKCPKYTQRKLACEIVTGLMGFHYEVVIVSYTCSEWRIGSNWSPAVWKWLKEANQENKCCKIEKKWLKLNEVFFAAGQLHLVVHMSTIRWRALT